MYNVQWCCLQSTICNLQYCFQCNIVWIVINFQYLTTTRISQCTHRIFTYTFLIHIHINEIISFHVCWTTVTNLFILAFDGKRLLVTFWCSEPRPCQASATCILRIKINIRIYSMCWNARTVRFQCQDGAESTLNCEQKKRKFRRLMLKAVVDPSLHMNCQLLQSLE